MAIISRRNCRHSAYDSCDCCPVTTRNGRLGTDLGGHECGATARQSNLWALDYFVAFLNRFRLAYAWCGVLALVAATAWPVFAEEPKASVSIKNAVILLGANSANDALSLTVPPGPPSIDLYLQVEKPLQGVQPRQLTVTDFQAQTAPAEVVATAMQMGGGSAGSVGDRPLSVDLSVPALVRLKLTGKESLRPGTTYKGWLFLSAGDQSHRWEVTLTTGGRGILAVEPIGTTKFDPWPWQDVGTFSVTVRDKSEGGPYRRLRVRFETSSPPEPKAITSNFSIDTFSFYEGEQGNLQRVDLEQRDGKIAGAAKNQQPQQAQQVQHREQPQQTEKNVQPEQAKEGQRTIDMDRRGQRTLTVKVASLSPGQYGGALRFASDESSDDSSDAKLLLTIQVRHFWFVPVIVILLGSLLGWYSSKYVVYARKARELARQVKVLRAKADDLARPDPPRVGWEFSSEATSYGLARVRVMLSQLALLTSRALLLLVREEEIMQQYRDAEQRLSALDSLHRTRLRVQNVADGRPAAQLALGRLLRSASDLLERPTFDQTQQADFKTLLQTADAWEAPGTRDALYRAAIVERRQGHEVPDSSQVKAVRKEEVRNQLDALCKIVPSAKIISDAAPENLPEHDQTVARLALLWREKDRDWAELIAKKCEESASLDELFRFVDQQFWGRLKQAGEADQLKIEQCAAGEEGVRIYDLVEVSLKSYAPDVPAARILKHPLRVVWNIAAPGGNVRSTETDGLTLVQYFPLPGKVTVKAVLRWEGGEIPIEGEVGFDVKPNPDFKPHIINFAFNEVAVMAIAAGFAVATAMSTQYDATFGTFNQYLTLFLWAAGAGIGGNLFKQLGTTATPGGQAEVTLPATAAGGGLRTP